METTFDPADYPPDTGLLALWHQYRTPIIFTAVALLLFLRFQIARDDDHEGLKYLPKVFAPPPADTESSTKVDTQTEASTKADTPAEASTHTQSTKTGTKAAQNKSRVSETTKTRSDVNSQVKSRSTSPKGPKRIRGGKVAAPSAKPTTAEAHRRIQPLVFFSSITTNTERIARDEFKPSLDTALQDLFAPAASPSQSNGDVVLLPEVAETQLLDLAQIDFDDFFVSPPAKYRDSDVFFLFLVPSYNIDTINDTFLQHLQETHYDFRVDTSSLSGILGYSVFGFGDREGWPDENEGFCFQAKQVDKWMAKLSGRKRAFPIGMGDTKTDYKARLAEWREGIVDVVYQLATTGTLGEGLPGSGNAEESDVEPISSDEEGDDDDGGDAFEDDDETLVDSGSPSPVAKPPTTTTKKPKKAKSSARDLDDVEDLGKLARQTKEDREAAEAEATREESDDDTRNDNNRNEKKSSSAAPPLAIDFTSYGKSTTAATKKRSVGGVPASEKLAPKEMVPKNSPTYASLTKQGYTIVGSHSGVKICRWTKSALRGRGSCYKYSFYGINSHQCMETTPSLSCSNKCVFCWRHGTNPVGTTWRWVVDPPDVIFNGVKAGHYQKIKILRGMAGVRAERYAEALRIRHCALSLVGEPIFYPYINEFLAMLHAERISSFLVCNAQHPDQLASLQAVTQLYVSIDASNKDSLRRIDRPLHRDFWERFQKCLEILREKRFRHRTVFRLTLVKGFNVEEEVDGYADLIEKALPCFVEVKGVTYCGTATSANAGLRMDNVPFYWEVCEFVTSLEKKLQERGLDYGIGAEHAHSCCILMASRRFYREGKWHTHIDYDRFFELLEERGPNGDWTPEDYMGPPTPEWATWGNGGFDPRDQRVDRKGRPITQA